MSDAVADYDIVVIGAGIAGHRTALAAAEAGASVAVIEKLDEPGGSTVMSGGSFAFAGTDLQAEMGIADSLELMRQDLIEAGGGDAVPDLIDALVEGQLAEYVYLKDLGAVFTHVQASAGHSVPRSHRSDPRRVIELLHAKAKTQTGIDVYFGTAATELIRPATSGPVEGAVATCGGEARTFHARNGVILASGGFSRSPDLLRLFVPLVDGALPGGGRGNSGDGLRMAWQLGAGFADLGHIKGTFGAYVRAGPEEVPSPCFPIYKGAIAVNRNGLRFADESRSYKVLGAACLAQPDRFACQIFDQSIMDQSIPDVPSYNFGRLLERGRIETADDLKTLAGRLELPADQLEASVATYNADVRGGGDRAFGRRTLTHHHGTTVEIATPPYYGYPCTTMLSSTYAGILTDGKARVLDVWNRPIQGLYAAGEVTGGLHGSDYMTGSALVKGLVFGRIAARTALD